MTRLKFIIKKISKLTAFAGRLVLFVLTLIPRALHYMQYLKAKRDARIRFRREHGSRDIAKESTMPIALKSKTLPAVTYSTQCWENDWKYVLNSGFLRKNICINNYAFSERILMINNVKNNKEAINRAERLVRSGVLTQYYLVDDHADEALNYFEISKESFAGGYRYSICDLVEIYICKTRYLLHYTGDSVLQNRTNWIRDGLFAIENENAKVVNPAWNGQFNHDRASSLCETDKFFIGYGFSDQCYLIRTDDFRAPIYNTAHPASNRYPKYGGELFEKRVDSWMHNNGWLRFTHKKAYYLHFNYFKNPF